MTAPVSPVSVPTREIGRGGGVGWWNADTEETPELRWPRSVKVYDRMRRQDGQVGSVLRALMTPIEELRWSVDPAGASDEVAATLAEELGLPILGEDEDAQANRLRQGGRFQWSEHLTNALLMLPFGHSFFEQQYRIIEVSGRPHAQLRKLGPRMPWTLSQIKVAEDGGLESITQRSQPEPIPVTQLVAYVNRREGGNWYGSSVLRTAYKHWLLKDRLLRLDTTAADRNSMGVPIYEAAANERDLAAGLKVATEVRSGEAAGASIAHGAKLRLAGVEGSLPDLLPKIRYHDEQIARSVLAHVLNLGQQANAGSWALGTTLMDFLSMSLNAIARSIRDTANSHIVEDWVDINYGIDERAPRIVCEKIGGQEAAIMAAVVQLIQAGAVVVDRRLEEHVRQRLDLPARDDSDPVPPAGGDDGGQP